MLFLLICCCCCCCGYSLLLLCYINCFICLSLRANTLENIRNFEFQMWSNRSQISEFGWSLGWTIDCCGLLNWQRLDRRTAIHRYRWQRNRRGLCCWSWYSWWNVLWLWLRRWGRCCWWNVLWLWLNCWWRLSRELWCWRGLWQSLDLWLLLCTWLWLCEFFLRLFQVQMKIKIFMLLLLFSNKSWKRFSISSWLIRILPYIWWSRPLVYLEYGLAVEEHGFLRAYLVSLPTHRPMSSLRFVWPIAVERGRTMAVMVLWWKWFCSAFVVEHIDRLGVVSLVLHRLEEVHALNGNKGGRRRKHRKIYWNSLFLKLNGKWILFWTETINVYLKFEA